MKWAYLLPLLSNAIPLSANPIEIGSRRELFAYNHLIKELESDIALRLIHPAPREIVIIHDAPWEGIGSGYHSIFKDGDLYRLHYKTFHFDFSDRELNTESRTRSTCYAESDDDIHWRKSNLGLHTFEGSTENKITISDQTLGELQPDGAHPAIFKDPNSAPYKATLCSRRHRSPSKIRSTSVRHTSATGTAEFQPIQKCR